MPRPTDRSHLEPRPGSFADEAEAILSELTATRELGDGPVHVNASPAGALDVLLGQAARLDPVVGQMLERSCAAAVRLERRVGADVEASYLQGFCHALAELRGMLRGLTGLDALELLRLELGDARAALPRDEPAPSELQACRRAGRDLVTAATEQEPF